MLTAVGIESAARPSQAGTIVLFPGVASSTGTPRRVARNPGTETKTRARSEASFEELRETGRRAVDAGRLREAFEIFDEALRLARAEGDQERIDLAFCNRSAVGITLGQGDAELAGLRTILLRNAYPESCFAAAYNLSRHYELTKGFKKGLFYGRVARDRARLLQRDDYLAKSYNQIGNCLLAESYFEVAATEYGSALGLLAEGDSVERATVLINLGYCRTMLGDLSEGFRLAFRSLRSLRRLGAHLYEAWPHLDLCYAYLETGRLERARRHGRQALAFAEKTGHPDLIKNALFLLGEVEQADGRSDVAYACFQRLQTEFYPESPRLASMMLAVDMRRMINLRA